jgi:hypothetical protein
MEEWEKPHRVERGASERIRRFDFRRHFLSQERKEGDGETSNPPII